MRRDLLGSKQALFRVFYRLGFTPWDNHALAQSLRNLVEGNDSTGSLPAGAALDVGCGTGDSSIYLSQHGWQVTGIDFTPEALDKACAKARAAKVAATADVISGGRIQMGIGGGWYEHEWRAYGYGFPSAGVRLGRLDEGVQIVRDAWRDGKVSFAGKHYQVDGAIVSHGCSANRITS